MVEDMEESLVERQAGTEDGCQHHLIGRHLHSSYAQRGLHRRRNISKGLGYFKRLKLTHPPDIVPKEQAVFLILLVPHLSHVLADDGVGIAQINDFHLSIWLCC